MKLSWRPPIVLCASFGVLVAFTGLGYLWVWPYISYVEYNPIKAMRHLEGRYQIVFPKGIKDVRVGVLCHWNEDLKSFVMRFTSTPDELDQLISSGSEQYSLLPYNQKDGEAIRSHSTPQWFRAPIIQGKQSCIGVSRLGASIGTVFTLYIDIDNPNRYVVYMMGFYYGDIEGNIL